MSGGIFGNFWRRLPGFGDDVRSAIEKRDMEPATAEAVLRILDRVEALAPQVKAVECLFDGDIVDADLVRLEARYGGKD